MATQKTSRKSASKGSNFTRFKSGLMTRKETLPLVMAAREAFAYQVELGNVAEGLKFDSWRHDQVKAITGNDGLTSCHHDDFRPLMAHFKILAGKDASAYQQLITTGPASDQDGDTHELRRNLAHDILAKLADHIFIADHPVAESLATLTHLPETRIRRAVEAIQAHPKGALREGYLIHLARQKTSRPGLALGPDLKAGLADRLTVEHLLQVRDTLVNRISTREGAEDRGRNSARRC